MQRTGGQAALKYPPDAKLHYSSFILIEDESAAVLIFSLNGKK
jgi:hypothetical protein